MFFGHLVGDTDGGEQFGDQLAVFGRGMRTKAIGTRAAADEAGRVRHYADDPLRRRQAGGQSRERDAGGDRHDECVAANRVANSGEDVGHLLRLDGQEHDVGL